MFLGFASWIWADTVHTVPKASNAAEHTEQICDPFFHKYLQKQSACLGVCFYTPVSMEVIGTPEFNYLDGWVNTFGNIVWKHKVVAWESHLMQVDRGRAGHLVIRGWFKSLAPTSVCWSGFEQDTKTPNCNPILTVHGTHCHHCMTLRMNGWMWQVLFNASSGQ